MFRKMRHFMILAAMIFLPFTVCLGEEASETETETVESADLQAADPCEFIRFGQEESLTVLGEDIRTSFSENGLLLSGKSEDVKDTSIVVEKIYDFGTEGENAPVCRIRIDGLAKTGRHVNVRVYLDGEEKPYAEAQLRLQTAENVWDDELPVFKELPEPVYGEHTLRIAFEDASPSVSGKNAILLRSIRFYRETLPVVYVNIDETLGTIADMNADPLHQTNCYGSVKITTPAGYHSDYIEEGQEEYTGGEYALDYIRGRGESTWAEKKKPYKLKLSSNADLFGMGANKHWALIANYFDRSFVRNRMTYYLGDALGLSFTPQLVPVEVVMNGEYLGLYYLSENIRLDSSRVDLDDLEDYDGESQDISGGYLLSTRRPWWEEKEYKFVTDKLEKILLHSPEEVPDAEDPAAKLEEMREYIRGYLNEMEDALFGEGFVNKDNVSYKEYMDLESAAKYVLIQAVSNNTDAYVTSSTYFYKEKDGKLYWGPLWDFDYVAWGGSSVMDYTLDEEEASMAAGEFLVPGNRWVERMKEDPEFVQAVKDCWGGASSEDPDTLAYQLNELIREGGMLDQYEEELALAAVNNADIPGNVNDPFGDTIEPGTIPPFSEDFHGEMSRLKRWIANRISYVDQNLDEFLTAPPSTIELRFYDGDELLESRRVYSVNPVNDLPVLEEKDDSYFAGWYAQASVYDPELEDMKTVIKQFSTGCTFLQDTDLCAHWIGKEDPSLPEDIFIRDEEICLPLMETYQLETTLVPAECDQAVFYSSSDPIRASVNDKGEVYAAAPEGDVTITVTTPNGLKKECLIHLVPEAAAQTSQPLNVSLDETEIELARGEYKKLNLSNDPQDSVVIDYDIYNGNAEVAYMTPGFVIMAEKPGTADIYLVSDNRLYNMKITVTVTE